MGQKRTKKRQSINVKNQIRGGGGVGKWGRHDVALRRKRNPRDRGEKYTGRRRKKGEEVPAFEGTKGKSLFGNTRPRRDGLSRRGRTKRKDSRSDGRRGWILKIISLTRARKGKEGVGGRQEKIADTQIEKGGGKKSGIKGKSKKSENLLRDRKRKGQICTTKGDEEAQYVVTTKEKRYGFTNEERKRREG